MFPFSTDPNDYKEITPEQADKVLSSGTAGEVREIPLHLLPDSLRKINNLASALVSGVTTPLTTAPVGGDPETVIFTVRNDTKDAPATGNLYAYLLLRTGDAVLMSPPCKALSPYPHHFSGACPLLPGKPNPETFWLTFHFRWLEKHTKSSEGGTPYGATRNTGRLWPP